MTAFDTDIVTDILMGATDVVARAALIPVQEQAVRMIVVEEIVRGRLETIRRAESGKTRFTIDFAYQLFEQTLMALRGVRFLPYTAEAETLLRNWRAAKVRGSTHDLRIAATAVTHPAKLVTRNRRDFEHVPGLSLEIWA